MAFLTKYPAQSKFYLKNTLLPKKQNVLKSHQLPKVDRRKKVAKAPPLSIWFLHHCPYDSGWFTPKNSPTCAAKFESHQFPYLMASQPTPP